MGLRAGLRVVLFVFAAAFCVQATYAQGAAPIATPTADGQTVVVAPGSREAPLTHVVWPARHFDFNNLHVIDQRGGSLRELYWNPANDSHDVLLSAVTNFVLNTPTATGQGRYRAFEIFGAFNRTGKSTTLPLEGDARMLAVFEEVDSVQGISNAVDIKQVHSGTDDTQALEIQQSAPCTLVSPGDEGCHSERVVNVGQAQAETRAQIKLVEGTTITAQYVEGSGIPFGQGRMVANMSAPLGSGRITAMQNSNQGTGSFTTSNAYTVYATATCVTEEMLHEGDGPAAIRTERVRCGHGTGTGTGSLAPGPCVLLGVNHAEYCEVTEAQGGSVTLRHRRENAAGSEVYQGNGLLMGGVDLTADSDADGIISTYETVATGPHTLRWHYYAFGGTAGPPPFKQFAGGASGVSRFALEHPEKDFAKCDLSRDAGGHVSGICHAPLQYFVLLHRYAKTVVSGCGDTTFDETVTPSFAAEPTGRQESVVTLQSAARVAGVCKGAQLSIGGADGYVLYPIAEAIETPEAKIYTGTETVGLDPLAPIGKIFLVGNSVRQGFGDATGVRNRLTRPIKSNLSNVSSPSVVEELHLGGNAKGANGFSGPIYRVQNEANYANYAGFGGRQLNPPSGWDFLGYFGGPILSMRMAPPVVFNVGPPPDAARCEQETPHTGWAFLTAAGNGTSGVIGVDCFHNKFGLYNFDTVMHRLSFQGGVPNAPITLPKQVKVQGEAAGDLSYRAADNQLHFNNGADQTVATTAMTAPLYNAAGQQQAGAHSVMGAGALRGGVLQVTLAGASAFKSATSYVCNANDTSAAAAVQVEYASGASVRFAGTGADLIRWSCLGN